MIISDLTVSYNRTSLTLRPGMTEERYSAPAGNDRAKITLRSGMRGGDALFRSGMREHDETRFRIPETEFQCLYCPQK